jgi:transmembrane sensor
LGVTPHDERRRQARKWYFERQRDSKLSRALERQWSRWAEDPANRAEYRDVSRLHSMLRTLPPPSLPSIAELHADTSDFGLEGPDEFDSSQGARNPSPSSSRVRPVLFSAGVAIAALVVLVWGIPRLATLSDIMLARTYVYTNPPGAPREIILPDHSTVVLSGSGRLTGWFSSHRRRLVLLEGEAYFKVRHDPAAPFQLDAGNTRIVDEGTELDVRRYRDGAVVVSVKEGSVTVGPEAHALATETRVTGGEQVTGDANGEVSPPRTVPVGTITSWLSGRRVYRGEPLAKVIEDVQLYLPQHIDLDRALRSVRFTGFIDQLDSQQAGQWVHGLSHLYPVEFEENAHRIFIRCSVPGCPGVPP